MKLKDILLISSIFLLILTIGAVSASDDFASDDLSVGLYDLDVQEQSIGDIGATEDDILSDDSNQEIINAEDNLPSQEIQDEKGDAVTFESSSEVEDLANQEKPVISISSTNIKTGQNIYIYLKDQNNAPLANQKLITTINKNTKNLTTDSEGKASLKLDFNPGTYLLNVNFQANGDYADSNKDFNIILSKLDSVINPVSNLVAKGKYFYIYLRDESGNALANQKVSFAVNGKTYSAVSNAQGKAWFKVSFALGKYPLKVTFNGDSKHNSVTKSLNLYVPTASLINIGNAKLLTNGYLRIYLRCSNQSLISKKLVHVTVNGKTFNKTTNNEGIIIFKPRAGTGSINISAIFDGNTKIAPSSAKKTIKGINGDIKSPYKSKIPLVNGRPDVDVLGGNYALADGNMTYSLNKTQYLSVIKRDSYCLFLNNRLSKYTFFQSKKEPTLNHIIYRKKWNVIERALNTKIVKKNKRGYWPQVTVSLKGKSYTYSEVRDEQDLTFTCGPTSSSMCSQALRNYVCESYLTKLSGARKGYGSHPNALKRALEKNHFKCSLYYKSGINKALKELKKGGAALVYHIRGHYLAIVDISKNGKKVLISNSRGGYNSGEDKMPTKWLTVKYVKSKFANDTPGLIVRLNYSLNANTKKNVKNFYSSMGINWTRQNTNERIPQI